MQRVASQSRQSSFTKVILSTEVSLVVKQQVKKKRKEEKKTRYQSGDWHNVEQSWIVCAKRVERKELERGGKRWSKESKKCWWERHAGWGRSRLDRLREKYHWSVRTLFGVLGLHLTCLDLLVVYIQSPTTVANWRFWWGWWCEWECSRVIQGSFINVTIGSCITGMYSVCCRERREEETGEAIGQRERTKMIERFV